MPLSDYIRETWQNAVTAINATRLNNIEIGLDEVTDAVRLSDVGTVAALRAQSVSVLTGGEKRNLLGYYVAGDSRQGEVYWDTLPAKAFTALASDDTFTATAHGYAYGQPVRLYGGTLPTGVAVNTTYYVIPVTVNTFKLASTSPLAMAEVAINLTADGSGTVNLADNGGTVFVPDSNPASGRWRRPMSVFHVDQFGAKGDRSTVDTTAIDNCTLAAWCAGEAKVEFNGTKSYVVTRRNANNQDSAVAVRGAVKYEGNGCELVLRDNATFIGSDIYDQNPYNGANVLNATITADVAFGASTYTVDSTTGFVVGDWVIIRLVNDPWDSQETRWARHAKITAIGAGTITLNRKSLFPMTVASTATQNRRITKLHSSNRIDGGFIKGFYLTNDIANGGNAEYGVRLSFAKNYRVEDVWGENTANHINVAYGDTVTVKNFGVTKCEDQGNTGNKGRLFSAWYTQNISFEEGFAEQFVAECGSFEGDNKNTKVKSLRVVNNHASRSNSTKHIFTCNRTSQVDFDSVAIEGNGGFPLAMKGVNSTDNENRATFRNLTVRTDTRVKGAFAPEDLEGTFVTNDQASATQAFSIFNASWHEMPIMLTNGMSEYTRNLPPGLLLNYSLYASSNVVIGTDLTALYFGRTSDGGSDIKAEFVPGQEVLKSAQFGSDYARNMLTGEKIKIIVYSGASGITGADKFIIVRVRVAPRQDVLAASFTSDEMKARFGLATF